MVNVCWILLPLCEQAAAGRRWLRVSGLNRFGTPPVVGGCCVVVQGVFLVILLPVRGARWSGYDIPRWRGLRALGVGMMATCFHMKEMLADSSETLKRWVRYWIPCGPRCLIWNIVRPSEPVATEILLDTYEEGVWGRHVWYLWVKGVCFLAQLDNATVVPYFGLQCLNS